ncbi:MAG: AAA family ATPase [Streptosporangiaceae bacterium]
MLLWINGPFGAGKTATASELCRRVPGSIICDPEHVGIGMHRMLPPSQRGDFQDLPAWRRSVRELLARTLATYPGPVIAPMTLAEPAYFDEIIGGLRSDGFDVRHFALLAEPATVVRRLSRRGLSRGLTSDTWALDHLGPCLRQLRQPRFAEHVETDGLTVPQVADAIAGSAGLAILPSTDGPVRARLRLYATSVRAIRLL